MRLNLGCGRDVADGWVNVDVDEYDTWPSTWLNLRNDHRERDYIERPGVYLVDPSRLPFDHDTFDGAVAHHVMQMIAWPDLVPWLQEVRRVLSPGATLRATVPDLLGAVDAASDDDHDWFPVAGETIDEKLCVYISQNGSTRSVFTGWALRSLLMRAGFHDVTWRDGYAKDHTRGPAWLTDLDSRLAESIVVEGVA